jgi:N-acetylneuraminic acid mutarotase
MPCNQARCYEVRATVSRSSCGTVASLLISERVSVVRTPPNPCTTPNTWVRLPDPPATMQMRDNYAIIAHDGFIYVGFGWHYSGPCLNDWWRWDPCSGTWTQLASPPVLFGDQPSIFAIGPYIYVGGGRTVCGGPINAFYRYDPATNTWTARANLPVPLLGAPGASDGTYGYVACGGTTGGTRSSTLYRYDPSTDSWTDLSTVPGGVGRWLPFMAYYQGKLYIGGGAASSGCRQDFYAYDIATNTWTPLPNHPNTHLDGWAVAYNGKIYVTGEHTPCCCPCTNQFYSYNIASNTWSSMPVFPVGQRNTIILVEVNGVLYGGWGRNCDNPHTFFRDWWAFCP